MTSGNDLRDQKGFMSNIWGWKWSLVSLVIVLLFLGVATCRYLVLKPDRLIQPENIEEDF